MVEYLDYPYCEQRDENTGEESATGNHWYCQLYLPSKETQTDGYPALVMPGVMTGHYVASYIPDDKLFSYTKVT